MSPLSLSLGSDANHGVSAFPLFQVPILSIFSDKKFSQDPFTMPPFAHCQPHNLSAHPVAIDAGAIWVSSLSSTSPETSCVLALLVPRLQSVPDGRGPGADSAPFRTPGADSSLRAAPSRPQNAIESATKIRLAAGYFILFCAQAIKLSIYLHWQSWENFTGRVGFALSSFEQVRVQCSFEAVNESLFFLFLDLKKLILSFF